MEKNCVIIPTHPQHYAEAHANLASLYLKLCPNHLFQLQVWTLVENKLARAS